MPPFKQNIVLNVSMKCVNLTKLYLYCVNFYMKRAERIKVEADLVGTIAAKSTTFDANLESIKC